jgi:hypothetical protein
VGFVVNKAALGQVFLRVLPLSPVSFTPPIFNIHLFGYHQCYTFLAIHNMLPPTRGIIFFLRYLYRNIALQNMVLRIFGPKREAITGEWRKLRTEKLHDP